MYIIYTVLFQTFIVQSQLCTYSIMFTVNLYFTSRWVCTLFTLLVDGFVHCLLYQQMGLYSIYFTSRWVCTLFTLLVDGFVLCLLYQQMGLYSVHFTSRWVCTLFTLLVDGFVLGLLYQQMGLYSVYFINLYYGRPQTYFVNICVLQKEVVLYGLVLFTSFEHIRFLINMGIL